jgi:protein-L-isoaspartate(D-aspartate) O-methyltransferase
MASLQFGRPASTHGFDDWRRRMVDDQLRGIRDRRVLAAMAAVPRHLFVPEGMRHMAYEDVPLPIGHGQTISQPRMVAITLQAAELHGEERVLEVGAGSGYQAALLSLLAREVYALEIIPELVDMARRNLARAGIRRVEVILADGTDGWPEGAPYEAIIVAAAAREIPEALTDQLAPGGRLLIPVGPPHLQTLVRVRRSADGLMSEDLGGCAFVPLVHGEPPSVH